MTRLVTWMFLHRPVGDPVRSGIPRMVELTRERLQNLELLLSAKMLDTRLHDTNFLEALQAPAYVPPHGAAYPSSRDFGSAVLLSRHHTMLSIFLRPARVTGAESPELVSLFGLEPLLQLVRFIAGAGAASISGLDGRYLPMCAVHESFTGAWERIKTGDVPRGGD